MFGPWSSTLLCLVCRYLRKQSVQIINAKHYSNIQRVRGIVIKTYDITKNFKLLFFRIHSFSVFFCRCCCCCCWCIISSSILGWLRFFLSSSSLFCLVCMLLFFIDNLPPHKRSLMFYVWGSWIFTNRIETWIDTQTEKLLYLTRIYTQDTTRCFFRLFEYSNIDNGRAINKFLMFDKYSKQTTTTTPNETENEWMRAFPIDFLTAA